MTSAFVEAPVEPTVLPDSNVEGSASPQPPHASIGDSVMRGALALLSTQPITWGSSLLAVAFVPRLLGADALGQYAMATSIAAVAGMAFGFGIPEYLVRRIAQHPEQERHDIGVAYFLHTGAGLFAALLVAVIAPFVWGSVLDITLLYIVLITIVTAPAQAALLASLRGREKHVWYAWINAGQVAVISVGGVLALLAGVDVRMYALVSIGLSTLSTLISWKLAGFWPALPNINTSLVRDCREFLQGGFPFFFWNITLTIYAMGDVVMLGFFVPSHEIGWYQAALKIVGVTVFIPTVIITPLFPALSRSIHEPEALRRALAQILRISLILTVPLGAGIFALAPVIPRVLGWPADFANAIPLIAILALHIPALAIDMVLGTLIMAIGRASHWGKVGFIAVVFNFGINLLAIPMTEQFLGDGAIGAATVTVLTEVLMFVAALVVIPNELLDSKIAWWAGRVIIAGVATSITATAVISLPLPQAETLPLAIIAGGVVYVAAIALVRALDLDDVRYVIRRFAKRGAAQPSFEPVL